MISYGNVLYGDMPKTASSYILEFLDDNLQSPKDAKFKRHGKTDEPLTDGQFCFVSVREPAAQYISLYRYGCDGKGGLFEKMRDGGIAGKYYQGDVESFQAWVAHLLNPWNAMTTDSRYESMCPGLYGLMTFRYLLLAVPAPLRTLKGIHEKNALRAALKKHSFVSAHVKTESLRDDMLALCDGGLKPFLKDDAAALSWLHRDRMKNKSKAPTFSAKDVDPETLDRIREREWLLYELLGY